MTTFVPQPGQPLNLPPQLQPTVPGQPGPMATLPPQQIMQILSGTLGTNAGLMPPWVQALQQNGNPVHVNPQASTVPPWFRPGFGAMPSPSNNPTGLLPPWLGRGSSTLA